MSHRFFEYEPEANLAHSIGPPPSGPGKVMCGKEIGDNWSAGPGGGRPCPDCEIAFWIYVKRLEKVNEG